MNAPLTPDETDALIRRTLLAMAELSGALEEFQFPFGVSDCYATDYDDALWDVIDRDDGHDHARVCTCKSRPLALAIASLLNVARGPKR